MHSIFKLFPLIISGVLFGTGTQFLTIPSNGLELAVGASAIQKNGNNPAAVFARGPGPVMNISHGSWLADSRISAIKISFPGQKMSYGLDLKYVELDDLELRSARPTDDPLSFYSASGFALGGSFSRAWLSMEMGAALRYIRIDLYSENSSGFAVDFGLTKIVSPKFKVGAAVLNAGQMSVLKSEIPQLPLRVIITSSLMFATNQIMNDVALTGEWSSLVNGNSLHVSSVSQWKNFAFRLGSKLSREVVEISGGVGLQFGIYGLNYGARFGSQDLGFPQMIDLSIQLP